MLEMSAIDTLNGGQITVSIQLIKLTCLAIQRRKRHDFFFFSQMLPSR